MHQIRQDSKLLLAQFKSKLKEIPLSHPSQSIHFRQFIKLLSSHSMMVHSKSEILKMSKFFDNPLKICHLQVPLRYLQLDSVKICSAKRYFVVRVKSFKVYPGLLQGQIRRNHEIKDCMTELIKRFERFYGNQNNWFRELGGNSIAMSIDIETFRKRVYKLLQNSAHFACVKSLTTKFLKDIHKKQIQWKHFMNVIKDYQFKREKNSHSQEKNNTFMTTFSIFSPKSLNSIDKGQSLDFCDRKEVQSSLSYSTFKKKRPSKALTFADQKQEIQFTKNFCLSAKKCVIYQKHQQNGEAISASYRTTRQQTRTAHRRLKTETNFYSNHLQLSKRKTSTKLLHQNMETQSPEKSQKSLKTKKSMQNKEIDPKVEQYVVMLENESGVQIQI